MLLHPVVELCFCDRATPLAAEGGARSEGVGGIVAETEFPDRTYRDYSPKR